MRTYIEALRKEFGSNIIEESVKLNEVYLTVEKEAVIKICNCLYYHFDLPLILIFATDERKMAGNFVLH